MKKIVRILFVIIGVGVAVYSAYAVDQMRTTEIVVADSASPVSNNQNYPFTLFIGDDLTDVTAPAMKSLTFTVTGVYTVGGSIALTIDSVASTTKSFTLPAVSSPTPFEIEYSSPGTISPTSGGSYDYTLNFAPTSVTVYGLGIKMKETHRYKPPSCADGSPSNQKMKATESIVADSASPVSNNQNYPFTLFIGDDLTDVTAPAMKSLTFTVTGVYTVGGSIALTIDSVASTTKSFTLPAVSSPTPFEIEYSSPGTISPTSGGSYDYTLNFAPTSVTVYGLGIKMKETHRYKPPSCSGMPAFGNLISAVFDSTESTDGAGYNSVMWKGTLGGPGSNDGKVRFQFATSNCSNGASNYPTCSPAGWSYIGSDGINCGDIFWYDTLNQDQPVELTCSPQYHNNQRYFRYKIQICSNNCTDAGTYTPTVEDVVVSWAP